MSKAKAKTAEYNASDEAVAALDALAKKHGIEITGCEGDLKVDMLISNIDNKPEAAEELAALKKEHKL